MQLLIGVDLADCSDGIWIDGLKLSNLLPQVAEHDAFDGNSRGGDGLPSKKTGDDTKDKPADSAQVIALTAWPATARQLGLKYCTVSTFVRSELHQVGNDSAGGQAGHEDLSGVDAYGPMLASVVDLDDSGT
jgi:hypothetical protein